MHWERWFCQGRVLERCVEENSWRWCGWLDDIRWGLIFAGGPLEFREASGGGDGPVPGALVLHCQLDTRMKDGRFACAREARRAHGVEELAPWPHDGWLLQAGDLGGAALQPLRKGADRSSADPDGKARRPGSRGDATLRPSRVVASDRPLQVC